MSRLLSTVRSNLLAEFYAATLVQLAERLDVPTPLQLVAFANSKKRHMID
jgi:hypothetical protein